MRLKYIICIVSIGLAMMGVSPVFGQSYPNKPIRLVVGFPPGGGADLVSRVLADQLSKKLNTPVIVINTPGAGSSIAAATVAKSSPDGYTLFLATSSLTINPSIYKSVNYDPVKSFVPIEKVGTSPFYVVVQAKSKLQSMEGVLDAARRRPGQLTYSSGGIGSLGNLAAELMKSQGNVNILHVPFKGVAPAVMALMAGTVDMSFSDMAAVIGSIREGRLRALAVTSAKRAKWLPNVPTIAEAGLPGYNVELWYGLFAPAGTPEDIVKILHDTVSAMLKAPSSELADRYDTLGDLIPAPQSQEEFAQFVRVDASLWKNAITKAGIKE